MGGVGRKNGVLETQPTVDVNKQSLMLYRERLTATDTLTPTSGKKLKIVKIQVVQNPDNSAANAVTMTMTSQVTVENPSGKVFDGWVGSDSTEILGNTDEALTISLANSQPVSVMINYKEI